MTSSCAGPGRVPEAVRRPRRDDHGLARAERPRLSADVEHERPLDAGEGLLLRRVRVRADEAAGADVQLGLEQLSPGLGAGLREDPALPGDGVGDVARRVHLGQAGSISTEAAERRDGPW